jgi:molybdenum cofactor synthesis domain-containing protein
MTFRIAILTVSDRCSRGEAIDTAGPALASRAKESLGGDVIETACVSDDAHRISQTLRAWATKEPQPDLILTTGGTGLSPRDVTPEATLAVLDRLHPGLVELMRARCGQRDPRAYLSRAQAGALAQTLIINLPGSERGAVESFDALVDILPHALGVLNGKDKEHPPLAPRVSTTP